MGATETFGNSAHVAASAWEGQTPPAASLVLITCPVSGVMDVGAYVAIRKRIASLE